MAFSLWTWACHRLKPATGQQITFKKNISSVSCTLEPVMQWGDTGQQIPFFDSCQFTVTWLSIRMSTLRLNTDCICLGHLNVHVASKKMPGHYKKTANQSACTIVAAIGVVTKISSCPVNITSRWGIKQLRISSGSIFILFSNE